MTATHILAIDQGTTSTRAIIFDADMGVVTSAQQEFTQHFPQSGWVEHDASDLWQTTLHTCLATLEQAELTATDIAAIGITNQRETTVVWDSETGETLGKAIVWQDRRTADTCKSLRAMAIWSLPRLASSSIPIFRAPSSSGFWTIMTAPANGRGRENSSSVPSTAGSSGT